MVSRSATGAPIWAVAEAEVRRFTPMWWGFVSLFLLAQLE
jgi:hypothetical protein